MVENSGQADFEFKIQAAVNHRPSITLCIFEYQHELFKTRDYCRFDFEFGLILMSYIEFRYQMQMWLNASMVCLSVAHFPISFAWLHSISLLNVWTRSMSVHAIHKMTNEYKRLQLDQGIESSREKKKQIARKKKIKTKNGRNIQECMECIWWTRAWNSVICCMYMYSFGLAYSFSHSI